jgi:zinc finger CCCH domain-containing protein 13
MSTSQGLTNPAAREDLEEAEANERRRARRDRHERHKREQRNGDGDPRERSDRDRGERSERRHRHRSERDRGAASDSDSDSTDDHVDDKPKMLEAPKSRKSTLEEPLMSGGLGEGKQDPLGLTNMGNLRENPDVPGQYTGYVRNPPMPQAATVKKASLMG